MGRTIIQPIGPLYGEAVNGTVFGRPNGSIYIPPTNTISVTIKTGYAYLKNQSGNFILADSLGNRDDTACKITALSQDNASHIRIGIYSDDEATTPVTGGGQSLITDLAAGLFNTQRAYLMTKGSVTISEGETYYLKCTLIASTGVPVAVSDILEVVAL